MTVWGVAAWRELRGGLEDLAVGLVEEGLVEGDEFAAVAAGEGEEEGVSPDFG